MSRTRRHVVGWEWASGGSAAVGGWRRVGGEWRWGGRAGGGALERLRRAEDEALRRLRAVPRQHRRDRGRRDRVAHREQDDAADGDGERRRGDADATALLAAAAALHAAALATLAALAALAVVTVAAVAAMMRRVDGVLPRQKEEADGRDGGAYADGAVAAEPAHKGQ